ncbi:MAG: ferritin-like domain-containing protein [Fermentimonas sp.]|nr:ferritin-like domain-containing protein [Fermentimonas sp.]
MDSKKTTQKKSEKTGTSTKKSEVEKKGQNNNKSNKTSLNKDNEGKLRKFFLDELKDIYFAEHEALKALKKMEAAATSQALKDSLMNHQTETEEQISRVEQVFSLLGEKPAKKKCEGILGIIKDGEGVVEDTDEGSMVRDAAIIIASQKLEHYEITSYGSLAELASTMGLDEAAELLEFTLDEEKSTDVTLTQLAEEYVNEEAEKE